MTDRQELTSIAHTEEASSQEGMTEKSETLRQVQEALKLSLRELDAAGLAMHAVAHIQWAIDLLGQEAEEGEVSLDRR